MEGLKYSVIKLSFHEKLLVRASYYSTWNVWTKKSTGPGPEISVHPGVTLSCILSLLLVFFVKFSLTENRKAACARGNQST